MSYVKTVDLGFTTIELYANYAIGRTKQGVHVTMVEHLKVLSVLNLHFSRPYGIIIDEVNDYSVDFHVFQHISQDDDICCIGVVYHRPSTKIALELGRMLIKKPIHFAKSSNEITNWMDNQVAS